MSMLSTAMNREILGELENTAKNLLHALDAFKPSEINLIPFEGSWTAGQVAEHLRKADGGIVELLYGTMRSTPREPDKMIEQIRNDFLDFSCKFQSPDILVPENSTYNKETLLQSLDSIFLKLKVAAKTLDLSQTNTDFPFPVYGELTRMELIWFAIYHTQRHIHQLSNIFQRLHSKH